MKILQVINSVIMGGAEKLFIESIPLCEQRGIDVDVLLLKGSEAPFEKQLKKNTNGRFFALSNGSVYNPLLIFKIIPFLKKYDLVHFHLFPTLYWVVIAKWLSFSKVKLLYTEHNTSNKRRNNKILRTIDRIIYKSIDKVVTISDDAYLSLQNHLRFKNNDDKYKKINNGVKLTEYIEAKPYNKNMFFTNDDKILIQISGFREQKDQKTVIKSLKFLPENVKLLLVGDGPLKSECVDLCSKLNLMDRVKFLGLRYDIPELLKTSDIVILSSKHEGLSLSSIEGMSVKPFIASDVPGLTNIVKDYGLLFEQGNNEELAEKILTLLNDPEYYDSIAKKCALRAKDFDINNMVDEYIEFYKKLVD